MGIDRSATRKNLLFHFRAAMAGAVAGTTESDVPVNDWRKGGTHDVKLNLMAVYVDYEMSFEMFF